MRVSEVDACDIVIFPSNRKFSVDDCLEVKELDLISLKCCRNLCRIELRITHVYRYGVCFSGKLVDFELLDAGPCLECDLSSGFVLVVSVRDSTDVVVIQVFCDTACGISCHLTFRAVLIEESHACIGFVRFSDKYKGVCTDSVAAVAKAYGKSTRIVDVLFPCVDDDEVVSCSRHL